VIRSWIAKRAVVCIVQRIHLVEVQKEGSARFKKKPDNRAQSRRKRGSSDVRGENRREDQLSTTQKGKRGIGKGRKKESPGSSKKGKEERTREGRLGLSGSSYQKN